MVRTPGVPPPFHLHWFYFIFEGVQEKHLQFARKNKTSLFTEKKPAYDYDGIKNYNQNNSFKFGKTMWTFHSRKMKQERLKTA